LDKLIEWTGERCVPWSPSAQLVYEHLHRYLWSAPLVRDRMVLDLASGEGYGSAILADSALKVVGLDVDPEAVEHSLRNYAAPNVEFIVGDSRDLSRFEPSSFGAVVAFEMIEHIFDQEQVLAEIARVLAPSGLLIMSTPDRGAYSDENDEANPFHVRELTVAQFTALLGSQFANVSTWGQRAINGSALWQLTGSGAVNGMPAENVFVERAEEGWSLHPELSPLYIVAVASNEPLPPIAAHSALGDCGLDMVHMAWDANETLRLQLDEQSKAQALARVQLDSELTAARARIERVEGSVSWQLLERLRRLVFGIVGGEGSAAGAALQRALRRVGRLLG
jgi:O-antigen biosynthesis protein